MSVPSIGKDQSTGIFLECRIECLTFLLHLTLLKIFAFVLARSHILLEMFVHF